MAQRDSPYVFREEASDSGSHDPEGKDLVIVDGESMSYRAYRGATGRGRR
jgi:hypothetical protein